MYPSRRHCSSQCIARLLRRARQGRETAMSHLLAMATTGGHERLGFTAWIKQLNGSDAATKKVSSKIQSAITIEVCGDNPNGGAVRIEHLR